MENVNKYFAVLEKIKHPTNTKDGVSLVKDNILIIKNGLNLDYDGLKNLPQLKRINCVFPGIVSDSNWEFSCCMMQILLVIKDNVQFDSAAKEDLLSIRQVDLLVKSINLATHSGITSYLVPSMSAQPFLWGYTNDFVVEDKSSRLEAVLKFLKEFLYIETIALHVRINNAILVAMAGIFSLFYYKPENQHSDQEGFCQLMLKILWQKTSKEAYFKHLLILKSVRDLPLLLSQELHRELLSRLIEKSGFDLLTRTLLSAQNLKAETPDWKRYEVVSKIVTHKGHSTKFYNSMIEQIFDFITACVTGQEEVNLMPAGIISLRTMCAHNENLNKKIQEKVFSQLQCLINPVDVVSGAILLDDGEFRNCLDVMTACFCSTSLQALPSKMLTPYLEVLLNLYSQLDSTSDEANKIKCLIIQCLANREKFDLYLIVKRLVTDLPAIPMYKMCKRVAIDFNPKYRSYKIKIVPEGDVRSNEIAVTLVTILKKCNNNILLYNVFLSLLQLLEEDPKLANSTDEINVDLLQDRDELDQIMSNQFEKRLSLLSCLSDLISFQPFHSQFRENPGEILQFTQKALSKRLNDDDFSDQIDHNLSLILAIVQQFLENERMAFQTQELTSILKQYLKKVKNHITRHQIESLLDLIEYGAGSKPSLAGTEYKFAISLLDEKQPHLRVYGITKIIGLIKSRDQDTLSNSHVLLAIGLTLIKDQESYTYLNCVRLFVALSYILEMEVCDALCAVYLNENEELDYRLKIGEAILKMTEELGQLSYKYKDPLVNCFLHGCKNDNDIFRTSSLSNLATVSRLLSYQVLGFFQELITILSHVIQFDKYVSAKRAAVMVLSQLLHGITNLVDFQELLIPTYRLLNSVLDTEKDERTRVHATNGLKALNDKCKEFLFPKTNLEKEIKIFGIKDDNSKPRRGHILELN